jgi:hypothetical protein
LAPDNPSANLQLPDKKISKFVYPLKYQTPKRLASAFQNQSYNYATLLRAHTAARCYLLVQLLLKAQTFDMNIDPRRQWWWLTF